MALIERNGDASPAARAADGEITRDEFLAWYLATGFTHLEKPHFACKKLEVPSMDERIAIFEAMDADGSGAAGHGRPGHLSRARGRPVSFRMIRMGCN